MSPRPSRAPSRASRGSARRPRPRRPASPPCRRRSPTAPTSTRAESKVELAVGRIESQLPSAVDPQVVTFSLGDFPVVQLAVTSDLDTADLAGRLESLTVTALEQIDGVSSATVYGATGQRITITPDAAALAEAGLSTQAIRDALKANGVLIAAGTIDENDQTLTVQAGVKIESTETLETPSAARRRAARATIGDVADGADRRQPDHRHLARQRRAVAHHRDHQDPGGQHRRGVARDQRPARRPRRRSSAATPSSRSSSTRRRSSSAPSTRSPPRACSASASP